MKRPASPSSEAHAAHDPARRRCLLRIAQTSAGALALSALGTSLLLPATAFAVPLDKATRDGMTSAAVLAMLVAGNKRFLTKRPEERDHLSDSEHLADNGQYPAAVILSCIDSRAPAEIILDTRLGDGFHARVAGNAGSDDIVGSLEFACAIAGAKVLMVMGHTGCGALKGAIDRVELGHLTGLLKRIAPAVEATVYAGDRSSHNPEFVDAVARTHALMTISYLRRTSPVLARLERAGTLCMVGSLYHLRTGQLEILH